MLLGRVYQNAVELRVPSWIDGTGSSMNPLRLIDFGEGFKVFFCFQHWCPGCHTVGFPSLKYLYDKLAVLGVGFAAIQTVFEGSDTNTFDKLHINQKRYGLNIPFGHDAPTDCGGPTFMEDYRTAGTPWFVVINPKNNVVYTDFRLDPRLLTTALETERMST